MSWHQAATPVLIPTGRVPLYAEADGGVSVPTLEISPADGLLYVKQIVGPEGLLWHTPNIALGALIAGLLVLLMVARRLRRVQERGRAYCRRCNYELSPPLAELGPDGRVRVPADHARCPECGVELGRRRPVAGRRRWRRVRPGLALGAVLVIGGTVALRWSLEPLRPGTWLVRPWPGQWIVKLAPKLAMQRTSAAIEQDAVRISRWRLRDGRHAGDIGTVRLRNHENARLSPAGDRYVYLQYSKDLTTATIAVVETRTRQKRRTRIRDPGWVMLAGYSSDGRSLYIQRTVQQRGQPTSDFILERYDLDTLRPTEIAREPYQLLVNQTDNAVWSSTPNSYFLVDESGTDPAWVLVLIHTHDRGTGTTINQVRTGGARPRKQHPFDMAPGLYHPPRLSPDGRSVVIPTHPPGSGTRIDLDTGKTTIMSPEPGQRGYPGPDGRLWLRGGETAVELYDPETFTVVAQLNVGTSFSMLSEPKFSDDGRWVACAVFERRYANPPNTKDIPCIYIWDLGQLDAAAPTARVP
ncbi:MAG: TolB family protein [Phycisphaerales bacterium]